MERRRYGSTDMEVSALGFGGSEIQSGVSLSVVEQLLSSALDAGLNLIDTAECYGDSEELIGRAVSGRRQDYYLFTKCGHAKGLQGEDWSPLMLEQSIDRSLKRLKTDAVDMIHLHSCSEEVLKRGDVIEVLLRAKEKGKTRYIGYSGDHKAARYAVESGLFDSLMTSFNIADQEAAALTLPLAREKGLGVTIKRPVANVAWLGGSEPKSEYAKPYWERLQKLDYPFLKENAEDSVRMALRFALTPEAVHTAIVGTTKPGRWSENASMLREASRLDEKSYVSIRSRWDKTAGSDWVGLG